MQGHRVWSDDSKSRLLWAREEAGCARASHIKAEDSQLVSQSGSEG